MDQTVQTGATLDALANDLRRALGRALDERGELGRVIFATCPTKQLSDARARLARQLARERGAAFGWGRCDAEVEDSPALAPLAQALTPVLVRRLRGPAPALRALLRRRAGALASLFPLLAALAEADEADDAQAPPIEALIELLAALTTSAPLALVLSRSELAAPALVELLTALTRAPLGRLVILALAGPSQARVGQLAPLRERAQIFDDRSKGECRPSPQLIEALSRLVANVREHFMLLDPEWTIWFINYTIPELEEHEVIGTPLLDYTSPDHRAQVTEHLERVRRTGAPARFITENRGRTYESLCVPVHDPGRPGDTCAYLMRSMDVTERRRTEQALADKARVLELAERLADGGSYEWDLRTNHKTWTEGMFRIFRISREEWQGDPRTPVQRVHPDDRDTFVSALRAAMDSVVPRQELNYRLLLPSGELRHIHASTEVIYEDGEPVRNIGTIRDVTAQVEAERTREALIGELREKNAELERFNYMVSHDLKSPLVTISGFLGFLEADLERRDLEGARAELPPIKRAVKSMASLIADLLSLSRHGKVVNEIMEFELETIVREASALLDGERAATGAELVIHAPLGRVRGDRERLRLVFQNLISNAIKFSAERPLPRVEIGARAREGDTEYYVRDNGVGIDPRFHQRVFGLFERLDNRREGSGIGLALVRQIVELHRGRVWVESEGEGAGATLCFTLGRTPDGLAST